MNKRDLTDSKAHLLEEGPRLIANLLDCKIADIKIGMRVETAYEDITGEITLVHFRPSAH